jgi:hypothetical protein
MSLIPSKQTSVDATRKLKLVFHQRDQPMGERDWFTFLLSDVVDEVVYDTAFADSSGQAIHVIDGNVAPLATLTAFFHRCRQAGGDLTLLHASDEWCAGGYREYRHFDRVIRTYSTWLAKGPGIFTIPLGYPNGMARPAAPAGSLRKYLWSFKGELKSSRLEMVEALKDVQPCFLRDQTGPRLTDEEYRNLLSDSVFLPCPMGAVVAETWRLYEALEFGCIPIVEKRWSIDYYRSLFGDDPFLRVANWREAAQLMLELTAQPQRLEQLQKATIAWWAATKERIKRDLTTFMVGPSYASELARFAQRPRNRRRALHEALRLIELMRHQSTGSLARRIADPRKVLRAIKRDSYGRSA